MKIRVTMHWQASYHNKVEKSDFINLLFLSGVIFKKTETVLKTQFHPGSSLTNDLLLFT